MHGLETAMLPQSLDLKFRNIHTVILRKREREREREGSKIGENTLYTHKTIFLHIQKQSREERGPLNLLISPSQATVWALGDITASGHWDTSMKSSKHIVVE